MSKKRKPRKSFQLIPEQHAILKSLSAQTGQTMSSLEDWALRLLERAPELYQPMKHTLKEEEERRRQSAG